MKFLKALFWLVVLAFAAGFSVRNWRDVTINLWDDLQVDIKIPVLLLLTLLVAFLGAWAVGRARHARLVRRSAAPPPALAASPAEIRDEAHS